MSISFQIKEYVLSHFVPLLALCLDLRAGLKRSISSSIRNNKSKSCARFKLIAKRTRLFKEISPLDSKRRREPNETPERSANCSWDIFWSRRILFNRSAILTRISKGEMRLLIKLILVVNVSYYRLSPIFERLTKLISMRNRHAILNSTLRLFEFLSDFALPF